MVDKRMVYELEHWSEMYMAQRASKIIDFYCPRCKKDFHGTSMYEHWSICSPKFFKGLSQHKKRRFGYVKQEPSGYLDALGPSPEPQQAVLFPIPGENSKIGQSNIQNQHVEEDPEPDS